MKNLLPALLASCVLFFATEASSQIITTYNFDGSIPSNITTTGIGASQSLSSTYVHSGTHSLKITTTAPSGLTFATANMQMGDPVTALSYAYYDQFGSSSPFYMYLFLGPATLAWQDSGLSGNTLIYGGINLSAPARVPGTWNNVSVSLYDNAITYSLNSQFIGYYLLDNVTSPISLAGFGIASAGPGTHSMYIDSVTVTTVPEPSTYALLGLASFALFHAALRFRRL